MFNFYIYNGDFIGLPKTKNHIVFRWKNLSCKILFSAVRQGDAISVHVASNKEGLKHLTAVTKEFCEFVLYIFPWSKMLIAKIYNNKSIEKLAIKCGFKHIGTTKTNIHIYIREKNV